MWFPVVARYRYIPFSWIGYLPSVSIQNPLNLISSLKECRISKDKFYYPDTFMYQKENKNMQEYDKKMQCSGEDKRLAFLK